MRTREVTGWTGWRAHAALAVLVSFGLSFLFWVWFGVFNAVGLVLWSTAAAVIGFLVGGIYRRHLGWTATVTAVARVTVFYLMTRGV